jgi:hypothetical protein
MPSPDDRRRRTVQPSIGDVCELRCAGVHPVHCNTRLRASTPELVVVLAREHGADAHGFTPRWYTPQRLVWMTERVKYRGPGSAKAVPHGQPGRLRGEADPG